MTGQDSAVTRDELHAYVDGELPPDRRAAVEAWLARNPDDAARVAEWRAQAAAIRARYGGVLSEPVPPRLDVSRLSRGAMHVRRAERGAIHHLLCSHRFRSDGIALSRGRPVRGLLLGRARAGLRRERTGSA